ncbi:hypothetical protein FLL45_14845 [Aliikangiella marina]|uniref:Uncharacterized protein n=1 Tax=Aliikangiella marina TaxID=1712262 RepID=A0A545T693_9GAMM|nr:hypothetical protein [Aliikangiella marina]TQV72750.1 hypothetical protein FLL45_14845 [Aliikangiella marina]
MLTVPANFTEGLVLLLNTPSGAKILESDALKTAVGSLNKDLQAHGKATGATRLQLGTHHLPAANQACVLAHELTHCLDLAFWDKSLDEISSEMIGATEINAHYNQGLIAKELSAIPGMEDTWKKQVTAMTGGNSTFGRMFDVWTRDEVFRYLDSTQQYGKHVKALLQSKVLYCWTRDDQWEKGTTMFHCEAHLEANNTAGPMHSAWG